MCHLAIVQVAPFPDCALACGKGATWLRRDGMEAGHADQGHVHLRHFHLMNFALYF